MTANTSYVESILSSDMLKPVYQAAVRCTIDQLKNLAGKTALVVGVPLACVSGAYFYMNSGSYHELQSPGVTKTAKITFANGEEVRIPIDLGQKEVSIPDNLLQGRKVVEIKIED